jgi:type VI secretion system secreted protein VgrG
MASRIFNIKSPLGKDLTFRSMKFTEGISQLFTIELELRSRRPDIDPVEVLGKSIGVAQNLANDKVRHFNGYCTSFKAQGAVGSSLYAYQMTVRPWLWFLSLQMNSRIFQPMSIPAILKKLFEEEKTAKFEPRITEGSYPVRDYCVQYRESTLNFVQRLMEQEGIYFFFEHTEGAHTLVFCDSQQRHLAIEGESSVRFSPPDRIVQAGIEHVSDWTQTRSLQTGRFSTDDYDPLNPSTELLSTQLAARPTKADKSDYEVFDYPGEYITAAEGKRYAQSRIEELQVPREIYSGSGRLHQVSVGRKFTLTNHPVKALNQEYCLLQVDLNFTESDEEAGAGSENSFEFNFTAMPSEQQYRPARTTPKPLIHGIQTAVVVGPSGEEIYTDEYGRVKVKFHWDRSLEADDKRSCWIRVATPWASAGFGFSALPRVGDEVVVTFLEGDPDQPLITGSVYNKQQITPYSMPGSKSQSGIRSRSYKGGGQENFNELKFEDKKGGEIFSVQAEKDMHKLVKNDQIDHIKGSQHTTVGGSEHHKVGKKFHFETGADAMIKVGGTQSVQAKQDIMTKAGLSFNVDAGNEVHIKSGATIVLEAGAGITLKVGGSYVSITPAGVSIQGPMVMINSGGAALSGSGLRLQSPDAPRTEVIKGRKGSKPVRKGKNFKPGGAAAALRSSAQGASTFTPQKCDC